MLCFLTVNLQNPPGGGKKSSCPSRLQAGGEGWLVLDKTCFYPEGGGPTGDRGWLVHKTSKAQIVDTQKRAGLIFHHIKVTEGTLYQGQWCEVTVDSEYRRETARSHSATHLLNQALREVLGPDVRQMGSLVRPGELRFDFSCPHPLSLSQITDIENKVLREIKSAHPVTSVVGDFKEAKGQGVLFLAGENYPPSVRTIRMGKSFELCGGIHVQNTSEVGGFKIISETGVQSGVRRLTAYTGDHLKKWQKLMVADVQGLHQYLSNLPPSGTAPAPFASFKEQEAPEKGNPPPPPEETKKQSRNPFIHWLKGVEQQIQMAQDRLKNLNPLPSGGGDWKGACLPLPEVSKNFTTHEEAQWVQQGEELYRYSQLPLPKTVVRDLFSPSSDSSLRKTNPFIPLFQKKKQELQSLTEQLQGLREGDRARLLVKQAVLVPCPQAGQAEVHLLTHSLPLRDTKLLACAADRLKSQLPPPSVVVLLGGPKKQKDGYAPAGYPLVVVVSSQLQGLVPAGTLFKKVLAPLLDGKGGGPARFAQGTIKNKSRFCEVGRTLQEHIKKT